MLAVPYPMQAIADFSLTVDTRLSERPGHVGVVVETAAVRRGYLWELILFLISYNPTTTGECGYF
jgi:hypothetical protein